MNWIDILIILVIFALIGVLFVIGHNLRTLEITGGGASRSEARIIKYLEEITGEKFPTVRPKWLTRNGSRMELDGYCKKLNLAMEFSGPLHTKWTPKIEPYEKYFERILRDNLKKKLCAKNNVKFFVVDSSLPARHWRNYVLSRLWDFEIIPTKPPSYIPEQTAVVWRNPQLEKELGLTFQ